MLRHFRSNMVRLAYQQDDDRPAIAALLGWMARRLQASRVDLVSSDAGPATVILGVGSGAPTRLGGRVLETGLTIGSEPDDPGRELGVPVRLGPRLVGANVLRWPVDRACPARMTELVHSVRRWWRRGSRRSGSGPEPSRRRSRQADDDDDVAVKV